MRVKQGSLGGRARLPPIEPGVYLAYLFAALAFAQRALAAATILARPSGESFRFFFTGLAVTAFTAHAGRPLFFAAGDAAADSKVRACSSRVISASISAIKLTMPMVLFSRSLI